MKHRVIKVVVGHDQEKDEPIYIRTIVSGKWKRNRDTLVHYHGYGGSAALNFKVFQDMSNEFNQISIDIIGMGGSSRPSDFSVKFSPKECIDYFVNYFEKWRVAFPDHFHKLKGQQLTQFYIVGHSLGGYLSSHYTVRYPQHIKKLILLSPVGLTNIASLDSPRVNNSRGDSLEATLCWHFKTCPQ